MKSPKIRFKEFNSKWDLTTLGELGEIIKGQQINKIDLLPSGKYYVLNGGITPSGYTNSFNTNENIISISEGGNSCGFVNFNKEKFWSGGHNYTLQNLVINTRFLYALLKYREKNIMSLRVGSGLPNIQKSSLLEFKIQIPTDLKEQEAIGEFFKNIDEILNLEKLRFKKFENFKKTMLDKLFVASGENTPRLRLGSFTSNWTSVNLGELGEIVAGGDIDKNKILSKGIYPVYANALTNDGIVGYYNDYFRISAPAVTITGRGEVGYAQARFKNFTPVVRLLSLKTDSNVSFIACSINRKKIAVESTGVPQLTKPTLSNIKIQIPTDLKEQEAIGEFFKKIDEILELSQNRISKLENIKKYLLNKMFV